MDPKQDSDGFQPLDREGLVQRVARLLSKAIVTGQLSQGERLSESVVARQLGVSRAPVRSTGGPWPRARRSGVVVCASRVPTGPPTTRDPRRRPRGGGAPAQHLASL